MPKEEWLNREWFFRPETHLVFILQYFSPNCRKYCRCNKNAEKKNNLKYFKKQMIKLKNLSTVYTMPKNLVFDLEQDSIKILPGMVVVGLVSRVGLRCKQVGIFLCKKPGFSICLYKHLRPQGTCLFLADSPH